MDKKENVTNWLADLDRGDWPRYVCEKCRAMFFEDIHVTWNYKYCPYCGRKAEKIIWKKEGES
jgi:DNA-directed RNA polymerase subunit RPC12/RpoP